MILQMIKMDYKCQLIESYEIMEKWKFDDGGLKWLINVVKIKSSFQTFR